MTNKTLTLCTRLYNLIKESNGLTLKEIYSHLSEGRDFQRLTPHINMLEYVGAIKSKRVTGNINVYYVKDE